MRFLLLKFRRFQPCLRMIFVTLLVRIPLQPTIFLLLFTENVPFSVIFLCKKSQTAGDCIQRMAGVTPRLQATHDPFR